MRRLLLLVILVLLFTSPAFSQLWTGILSNTRAIDWSDKGATVENRTTICATLDPGATAAQINTAIAGCSNDGVVYLTTGTFNLTTGLVAKQDVTLRGAGPHLTKLVFAGNASIGCGGLWSYVCVGGPHLYHVFASGSSDIMPGGSHARNWTAGFNRGDTQITVNDATGLISGMEIILDQKNDIVDNGEWVVGDTVGTLSMEGGSPGRTINGVVHSQQQYVNIVSVLGNVLTISPGLYASNWSASKDPGIFWTDPISGFGLEDLTIDQLAHVPDTGSHGVSFHNAFNSWIKNVRSLRLEGRNHVNLYLSSHITVANSYFWGGPTTPRGYQIETFLAGEFRNENNIFEYSPASIMNGSAVGTVHGYNYGVSPRSQGSAMNHIAWHHDAGISFVLYEGNQFNGIHSDNFHGPSDAITFFRNRFTGHDAGVTVGYYDCAFLTRSFHRFHNIIGNVLGETSYHNLYELYPPTPPSDSPWGANKRLYVIGYGDGVPNDVYTRTSIMRWGNYDVVNDAEPANDGIHWEAGEVPSGLAKYSNAVPSDHILPNSFYLAAAPSYWTNPYAVVPWPPIGPDIAGGTGPGGHSYNIPSKLCHDAMVVVGQDPAYSAVTYPGLKLFNGGLCYASNTPPPGDTTAPVITITVPTAAPIYAATVSPVIVSGTASDAVGVTSVTWSALYGQSGTATGTTNWTITSPSLSLAMNTQILTVTAWDAAGNKGTDVLNITYTPPPPGTTTGLRLRIKK